jgi:integrase
LGKWNSKESKTEYARVLSEWHSAGCKVAREESAHADITIVELLNGYWQHAKTHYRHADGTPTSEVNDIRLSLRPLHELYGHTLVKDFGPLAIKSIRQRMIVQPITTRFKNDMGEWQSKVIRVGLARGVINQRIDRIRRCFKWGVENQLVPVTVYQALMTVAALRAHRSEARETQKILPVSEGLVNDTLPHLSPVLADLIRVQLLTGARSGEVCAMRGIDIDMAGAIWLFRPVRHKTTYRGLNRVICIGPAAQDILRKYLSLNTEDFLFSPRRSMEAFRAEQRANRKSKVQPSQQCRAKRKPRKQPGACYTVRGLAHAVAVACRKAGLPHWHPHMLRHRAASNMRREFGIEATRTVLGHQNTVITETYAEKDLAVACQVAAKLG